MKTIAIVFGGESCEHDISVITALSAKRVAEKKYEVYLVYYKNGTFWMGDDLKDIGFYKSVNLEKLQECRFWGEYIHIKARFREKRKAINCALVACHGGNGENGALSGYFETVGTPYTSCGVFQSGLFMDKVFSKLFFEKMRLSTVKGIVIRKGQKEDFGGIEYPVIIKPARLGSSVGIEIANDKEELEKKLQDAFLYDEKVLVEKKLSNFREFNCAVCKKGEEVIASEVEEPVFKNDYLDFYDKYTDKKEVNRVLPAEIDEKLREKIRETSKRIYEASEMKGIVRIDFLYAEKKLYVNEVNTVPGGLALYLFLPLDIKATEVLSWCVENSINECKKSREYRHDYSSTVLQHYVDTGIKGGGKGFPAK